jgi:hypothetical protein
VRTENRSFSYPNAHLRKRKGHGNKNLVDIDNAQISQQGMSFVYLANTRNQTLTYLSSYTIKTHMGNVKPINLLFHKKISLIAFLFHVRSATTKN